MIISHKYKYIFVAIHHTASTVIERELCEYYEGVKVRHKHSLPVFLPRDVKGYKIIGGIRNPATDIIAQYNKYATDHKGIYSAQVTGEVEHVFMTKKAKKLFQGVQSGALSVLDFINASTSAPYVARISLNRSRYSCVYRMEDLETEFPRILDHCDLSVKRSLPRGNRTAYGDEQIDIENVLRNPKLRPAAVELGYLNANVPASERLAYELTKIAKTNIWRARELKAALRDPEFYRLKSAKVNQVPEM